MYFFNTASHSGLTVVHRYCGAASPVSTRVQKTRVRNSTHSMKVNHWHISEETRSLCAQVSRVAVPNQLH